MTRMQTRRGVGLAALMVLGFAGAGGAMTAPAAGAQEAPADPARIAEAAVIAAHPALLRRTGRTLHIGEQTYVDSVDCESGDDCLVHYVDAVWKGQHVGLRVHWYEGQEYMLVTNGAETLLGEKPIPSPSGERFFAGWHDDRDWAPHQGASVWEWDPHPRRLRLVDTALVMFDSFVAWRGEGCVEFTGARGFGKGLEPIRSFWLFEQDGDWALTDHQPAQC